jgi:hypothetical protein
LRWGFDDADVQGARELWCQPRRKRQYEVGAGKHLGCESVKWCGDSNLSRATQRALDEVLSATLDIDPDVREA